jgi:hypothetical protein
MTGALDNTFQQGTTNGFMVSSDMVLSLAADASRLYIGGKFTYYRNTYFGPYSTSLDLVNGNP